MSTRVLVSPSKYIQGSGELSRIKDHIFRPGRAFLFVMGGYAYDNLKDIIKDSFLGSKAKLVFERFGGECTHEEIDRLREIYTKNGCTVTVGVGGGKALDTAKAVAYFEKGTVISIPTIASTDAPTSALSIVYTKEHVFAKTLALLDNPEVVLVDTDVIMNAPVRFLVSGMGDALSTYFEARANAESGHVNFAGGLSTRTSLVLAKLCYDILIRDGLRARWSVDNKVHTKELEDVIEANIYLSGVGFESNGLACAHSIYNAITSLPKCHHMYHGELVAFGTIVQLVLEKRPDSEIKEAITFCISIGLPVSFYELTKDELTKDEIMNVAVTASGSGSFMESEPFDVTPEMIFSALMETDALGRSYRGKRNY